MEPFSSPTASAYFGAMVESYDSLIRRAVPRYEEMSTRLVEYLPPAAAHILELGCGTGNLSLRLAKRYPTSEFTFADASPEMVELTRRRLESAFPGVMQRSTFLVTPFEQMDLARSAFDLITSSISLHHVEDKGAMYRSLRSALVANGWFCFADQMGGGSREQHRLNWERWLAFCQAPGNCSEQEVESLLAHAAAHDHYTPVAEHFALLEQAGFTVLDCVWRNWMWGIITVSSRSQ